MVVALLYLPASGQRTCRRLLNATAAAMRATAIAAAAAAALSKHRHIATRIGANIAKVAISRMAAAAASRERAIQPTRAYRQIGER